MTVTFTQEQLYQFFGSEHYYRTTPFMRDIVHTDGAQFLGKNGGYWMLDLIVSYQFNPAIRREPFQVWKFIPDGKGGCAAICSDGNEKQLARQEIEYTDLTFPVEFYAEMGSIDGKTSALVIMLPNER